MVQNDILMALDDCCAVFLLLLDLSVAFDIVQHSALLSRLQSYNGITGQALTWMESYLCNRKQSIAINYSVSPSHDLHFGVPQGSVLELVLFSLYTSPITDIIRSQLVLSITFMLTAHSCTWHSTPPVVRTSLQLRHVLKLVSLKFVFGCLVII